MSRPGRPAAFLDRDDTITRDPGYLDDPAGVELLPGAAAGMRQLAAAGFALVVVTNQSGLARGYFDEARLAEIHAELRRQLHLEDVAVEGIYYSPFHPDGVIAPWARMSDCRKPGPGMLLRAAEELGLELARSLMVGDKPSDVEAGWRAGCAATALVGAAEVEWPAGWRPATLRVAGLDELGRHVTAGEVEGLGAWTRTG